MTALHMLDHQSVAQAPVADDEALDIQFLQERVQDGGAADDNIGPVRLETGYLLALGQGEGA